MCVLVHAVSHAGSRELHATRLEVRPLQTASGHATHMHASASVRLYICYKLSHAHHVHAKHAQVRSAERLCPQSVSGGLNGRDNDGLGRYDLALEGSHGPAD